MSPDGELDEDDLKLVNGLYARLRRKEAEFQRWRRMPDYHEAAAARQELRMFGFDVAPGTGWDGPPVAG